jgi:hypothetical protein
MNELLTPKDFLIMGFFGIWGLVGVSIIATLLFTWLRDRQSDSRRTLRPHRRRRA